MTTQSSIRRATEIRPLSRFLTVHEVTLILGISRPSLYAWMGSGHFPRGTKIGPLQPWKESREVAADAVTFITEAATVRRWRPAARRKDPALTRLAAKYGATLISTAPKRTEAEIEAATEWAARLQLPVEAVSSPRERVGLGLELNAAGLDCPVWDRILPIAPDLFTRRGRRRIGRPAKRNRPAL